MSISTRGSAGEQEAKPVLWRRRMAGVNLGQHSIVFYRYIEDVNQDIAHALRAAPISGS